MTTIVVLFVELIMLVVDATVDAVVDAMVDAFVVSMFVIIVVIDGCNPDVVADIDDSAVKGEHDRGEHEQLSGALAHSY